MVELAELGWGRDDPAFRHVFSLQFMPDGTREQWAAFDELQRRTATPANAARIMAATADLDVASLAPQRAGAEVWSSTPAATGGHHWTRGGAWPR